MDVWEPSLPGAGAQRAVLVVQLYMRIGNYNPMSVLVADALCVTFKAGGATVAELGAYLGLQPDRVEAGIEGMPKEMYCTSSHFHQHDVSVEERGKGSTKRGRQDGTEESALRFYINYATALPFAFAHGTHMLLALCQLPVPQAGGNGELSVEIATLNVSPTLWRVDSGRGLCCASCRYWMALKDLRSTISRCPLCQADILSSVLCAIKARYEEKLARGQPLLTFGPLQQQRTGTSVKAEETANDPSSKVAGEDAAAYPLARDPFLVQQGLFFHFLYSRPFVCVNDAAFVVDPDEVMTKEEYEHRSKHRATVLDQFRLVHRNAGAIRVKCLDQEKLDMEKCMASVMKVAKRAQLPPWLRSVSLYPEGDELPLPGVPEEENTMNVVDGQTRKRVRRQFDVAATAKYIAREFFDNDYDEVPLRNAQPE
ncbi:hypothetical protein DQ04_04201020 [Trypanosoma grayi]|uniref:hypothetical protein n=1 Tax=Trypanosoma grayi TaxID=71804 RepID=UPI0004F45E59|nr:hypothetical protein DQ04_04201020 [Trypanosoma grayi]KEG10085.1 hypothetical protein DQ04_04201020 [Trypanosoma grayi]